MPSTTVVELGRGSDSAGAMRLTRNVRIIAIIVIPAMMVRSSPQSQKKIPVEKAPRTVRSILNMLDLLFMQTFPFLVV